MSNLLIIIVIIKLISFEILIFSIVLIMRKALKEKKTFVDSSILYIKENFGRINSIVAPTRGGKSCFMSALAHSQDVIIRQDLNDRLDVIINTLYYLDFNKINSFLDSIYIYNNDYHLAYELLLEYINEKNYVYFDFINIKSLNKMIEEYSEWYYHLNYRGTFMMCKGISIFDRNNGEPAKLLMEETLNIKEVVNTHIYYDPRCTIYVEDELSVTDSNSKSYDKDAKDTGKKEKKIFLGQTSKETSYYNSSKQTAADEIVTTRRLTNVVYVPTSCNEIAYDFPRLQRFLDLYLKIRYFFFKLKFIYIIRPSKRRKKIEEKMLSNRCGFKKSVALVEQVKSWCRSEGLLVHRGILFDNDPLNGKLKIKDDTVILPLPLIWSWGAYQTHEYSDLQELLESMSEVKIDDILSTARISNGYLTYQKLKWVVEKEDLNSKENNF